MAENDSPSKNLVRCATCRRQIVVLRPNGEVVLFGKPIIFKSDSTVSVCPQCHAEVPIPDVHISPPQEYLYLKADKDIDKKKTLV